MNDLTHLASFVVLAEELHFGRAAQRLHISQPPLTQQIQRLEARLGVALFQRNRQGTQLTAAGTAFLPHARQCLRAAEQAAAAARATARGQAGSLLVATPPSVLLTALPKQLARFHAAFPAVQLTLRELSTAAITDLVRAGGCDLAYLRATEAPADCQLLHRQQEGLTALLPARHPLAKEPKLRLRHLATQPFVLFPSALGSSFHAELLAYCRRANFVPNVRQEATQWSSVLSLVAAGFGVSIAPAGVASLRPTSVVARPLPGLRTTLLLVAPPSGLSPTAEHFVRFVTSPSPTRRKH